MSGARATSEADLLTDLLKAVSRSFYLTLRVLPALVRRPISLAYLLARTTDTVADTEVIDCSKRLTALDQLEQAILSTDAETPDFAPLLNHQARAEERELLSRIHESLLLLRATPEPDRQHIQAVLKTIISGQRLDLQRFAAATKDHIICLPNLATVDDYTYRVAGCVGEFWTQVCYHHLAASGTVPPDKQIEQGIRFGQGLQLVNILRDLAEDLDAGRCYLPADELTRHGIPSSELRNPEHRAALTTVYQSLMDRAYGHLEAGWNYTINLPWRWIRIRLACAWPILLGFKTLERLPIDDPANLQRRAKVTRAQVRSVLFQSIATYPIPRLWQRLGQGFSPPGHRPMDSKP